MCKYTAAIKPELRLDASEPKPITYSQYLWELRLDGRSIWLIINLHILLTDIDIDIDIDIVMPT